ncbi:hypothetical protein [Cerasicoccus arenae]|uniref:Outer membrane lipoprotein-sorting protein n=1 Tax=Cerasicoccus arenae TaxID=424488 RepID=A0A8J3DKG4_9BACT|nr:hypothetical protein [Cerasicoccus arenae]MBK1858503.1 hypothetical protein [Cerasicoccus arenae]GHC10225.1 hypothetical protein GCM10007047_29430 [Cerasicoccus arenae]
MKALYSIFAVLILATTLPAQNESSGEEETQTEVSLREPVPAQTDPIAAKLVETYLKASGGKDRQKAIHSAIIHETIREGKKDYRTISYRERPDKLRLELITESLGREYKVISGYDGTDAWTYDLTQKHPFPKEMGGKEKKNFIQLAAFDDILMRWEEEGCVLEYMGAVNNRKQKNYLVKLFHPDGLTEFFYFHPKNYLITRQGRREERNGVIVDIDSFYVKYDNIEGIWLPMKTELVLEDQIYGYSEVTSLQLNPHVSDDLFAMPKVKEVWLRGNNQ